MGLYSLNLISVKAIYCLQNHTYAVQAESERDGKGKRRRGPRPSYRRRVSMDKIIKS